MHFIFHSYLVRVELQAPHPRDFDSVRLELSVGMCILTRIPADFQCRWSKDQTLKTALND